MIRAPLTNCSIAPEDGCGIQETAMSLCTNMRCSQHSGGRYYCDRVIRVVDALLHCSQFEINNRDERKLFKYYIEKIYTYTSLIEDYRHIFKEHGDVKKLLNLDSISPHMFPLHRYGVQNEQQFRDRDYLREMVVKPGDVSVWCDLLNSMHCHLFHHRDMGIRIKAVITRKMSTWNTSNFQFIRFHGIEQFGFYISIPPDYSPRKAVGDVTSLVGDQSKDAKSCSSGAVSVFKKRKRTPAYVDDGAGTDTNNGKNTALIPLIDAAEDLEKQLQPINNMKDNKKDTDLSHCTKEENELLRRMTNFKRCCGVTVSLLTRSNVRFVGEFQHVNEEQKSITLKHGMFFFIFDDSSPIPMLDVN